MRISSFYLRPMDNPANSSRQERNLSNPINGRDLRQSLNDPRPFGPIVRPWSSLVYDISLPTQRSAERRRPGKPFRSGSGIQIPAAAPNMAKPRQGRTRFLEIG